MIPYGKQEITADDIEAVVKVLKSDFITQGPVVPQFEKGITDYTGAKYAVAVNSATSALHISCLALDLGKGDILWTTPITFVASANCALYCGASVDFVDINPQTYNISAEALNYKFVEAEKNNKLPKVLVAVHLTGQSCEMNEIKRLADQYNCKVIEDASHAIGGKYQNKPIGNCLYSDITVFSFHPVKIITSGEGGMAVTNQKTLSNKLNLLRSHGITRDQSLMTQPSDEAWIYEQIELGFNYRMTDIHAALGLSQLKKLGGFVSERHKISNRYKRLLKHLPLTLPHEIEDSYSGLHLFVIRLKLDLISKSRKEVFDALRASGIGVNIHYIPVHTQPFYQNLGFKTGDFPESEKYYQDCISLPMYHTLSEAQQDEVIAALEDALR